MYSIGIITPELSNGHNIDFHSVFLDKKMPVIRPAMCSGEYYEYYKNLRTGGS